jgi:hypothetical protein
MFSHPIHHSGNGAQKSDSRQRIAAISIGMVICTVLYGVLYIAMH